MDQRSPRRIEWIDLARGLALAAMAIYHFTWDLEFFGYTEAGMTAVGGWKLFARTIASSFLFLVGVSLVLAHGNGIRWQGYWRRLAMIVAAAIAVTVVTWFATPDAFIFFGILHQIAFASVVGLLFLRLPPLVTLAIAAAVIAAPYVLTSAFFNSPAWWWIGLSEARPRSSDYVPVLPWLGAVLAGIAAAGLAVRAGLFERLRRVQPGAWSAPFQFAGRHSLAVYLIHQPILISCLWIFAQFFPAPAQSRDVVFQNSCQAECATLRDEAFCKPYCLCVLDGLEVDNRLDEAFASDPTAEMRARLNELAEACTADVDETVEETQ